VKKLLVVALAMSFLAATALPAQASAVRYRYRHSYCRHATTHTAVKMWEYGDSGVMQFEITFISQEHRNGAWHNVQRKAFSSRVFPDNDASHSYGFIPYGFTWSNHRPHREEVRLIWWHRHPSSVVSRKTLDTRSCR
jgi:hypothetical protein